MDSDNSWYDISVPIKLQYHEILVGITNSIYDDIDYGDEYERSSGDIYEGYSTKPLLENWKITEELTHIITLDELALLVCRVYDHECKESLEDNPYVSDKATVELSDTGLLWIFEFEDAQNKYFIKEVDKYVFLYCVAGGYSFEELEYISNNLKDFEVSPEKLIGLGLENETIELSFNEEEEFIEEDFTIFSKGEEKEELFFEEELEENIYETELNVKENLLEEIFEEEIFEEEIFEEEIFEEEIFEEDSYGDISSSESTKDDGTSKFKSTNRTYKID